jgi:succinyl-CoA synthetase beta subunit
VENACGKLLGSQLITPQTDAKGLPVNQLLIEAGKNIKQELYLGLLVDRQTQKITVLASLEGGMDIEKVASETPDKIIKFGVDPLGTLSLQDCDSIALTGKPLTSVCGVMSCEPNNLPQAFSTASTS